MDRKPLEETHPHLKDFVPFLEGLNNESPRGAVLVAMDYIEELLLRTIGAFIVEGTKISALTSGMSAPLGSLSARAQMAACLGLISEYEHREITTLRKIRNEFAHHHRATFGDQRIMDLCENLALSAKETTVVEVNSRAQFTTSAVAIILSLTNRPHYVAQHRLTMRTWPY